MRQLTKPDIRIISEKIMELGNLALGSLYFGQIFNGKFNIIWAIFGLLLCTVTYVCSIIILKLRK